MRGGWRGSMGTIGGLTRTYGLQCHFSKPDIEGIPPDISRAETKRIARYFLPYWPKWSIILVCIIVNFRTFVHESSPVFPILKRA